MKAKRLSLELLRAIFMVVAGLVAGEVEAADKRPSNFPPSFGPITDADPAVREEREVSVPTEIRAFRTADELAVCENAGPLKPIKLQVGHKMILGMRRKFYLYREGTARPAQPLHEELGGLQSKVSDLPSFYLAEPFGFIRRGQSYVVEMEVAIFETDIPGQHMWIPESGKYKVLWETTLRSVPKEEPAFPEDIRKWKAKLESIKPQPVPPPNIPPDFLPTDSEEWKRLLATKITAGFRSAPIGDVVHYLASQTHAAISLRLKAKDPEKQRSIFRGFHETPLRDALYWLKNDTQYRVEWELRDGEPVGIVITDE